MDCCANRIFGIPSPSVTSVPSYCALISCPGVAYCWSIQGTNDPQEDAGDDLIDFDQSETLDTEIEEIAIAKHSRRKQHILLSKDETILSTDLSSRDSLCGNSETSTSLSSRVSHLLAIRTTERLLLIDTYTEDPQHQCHLKVCATIDAGNVSGCAWVGSSLLFSTISHICSLSVVGSTITVCALAKPNSQIIGVLDDRILLLSRETGGSSDVYFYARPINLIEVLLHGLSCFGIYLRHLENGISFMATIQECIDHCVQRYSAQYVSAPFLCLLAELGHQKHVNTLSNNEECWQFTAVEKAMIALYSGSTEKSLEQLVRKMSHASGK